MPRYAYDGIVQLRYAATLTPATPSLATINAGTDLTPFWRGGSPNLSGSTVDVSTANSRFNQVVAGTYGGDTLSLEFVRDRTYASDLAWTLLVRGLLGYFVFSWRGPATGSTLAVGDRVDVYSIEVITRNPAAYGRNEAARFTAEAAINAVPSEDVALVT